MDLRPESPTYLQHVAVELTEDNHRALYVPERFAHGYQALEDGTETSYQVGEFYTPGTEGGLALRRPAARPPVAAAGHRDLGKGRALEPPLDEVERGACRTQDDAADRESA